MEENFKIYCRHRFAIKCDIVRYFQVKDNMNDKTSGSRMLEKCMHATSLLPYPVQGTPVLYVSSSSGSFAPGIGWPCAGVQNLFIYTCVILLFLKKSTIPLTKKTIILVIGAIGTYVVNILRIVSIYVIAINQGGWRTFHDYY